MAEQTVRFYDLSGPKPWSPYCWCTRYALNYKGIPYSTVKTSYPAIEPLCQKLFVDMTDLKATVPIIEIPGPNYKALNDSTPIAELLNERFTEKDGYKTLKDVDKISQHDKETEGLLPGLAWLVFYDVYLNALDPHDGSKEFFKETREKQTGVSLSEVTDKIGGGEEACLKQIAESWTSLRERMKNDDLSGDPTYLDFRDAAFVKWIQAASKEKYEKLLGVYSDDTFTKLMKKVEKYEQ